MYFQTKCMRNGRSRSSKVTDFRVAYVEALRIEDAKELSSTRVLDKEYLSPKLLHRATPLRHSDEALTNDY